MFVARAMYKLRNSVLRVHPQGSSSICGDDRAVAILKVIELSFEIRGFWCCLL